MEHYYFVPAAIFDPLCITVWEPLWLLVLFKFVFLHSSKSVLKNTVEYHE